MSIPSCQCADKYSRVDVQSKTMQKTLCVPSVLPKFYTALD